MNNSFDSPSSQINLRPRQAAKRHGVSVSWLWNAVAEGKLSAPKKIGHRISLFSAEQLDREIVALMHGSDGSKKG